MIFTELYRIVCVIMYTQTSYVDTGERVQTSRYGCAITVKYT